MTTFGDLDGQARTSLHVAMRPGEPVDPAGLRRCLEAVARLVSAGQARTFSARRPDIAQTLAEDVNGVLAALPAETETEPAPGPLHRAADLLGAGRDLLATHSVLTAHGPVDRSDLAAVVDSPAGRTQILRTAGVYASDLAALASRLAVHSSALPLRDAARVLAETAEASVWSTRHAGTDFIAAVPALAPLSRDEPTSGESPAELVERAAQGAERLHLLAFRAAQRSEWIQHPPETLARCALAMAASQHTAGRLLRHLAGTQDAAPREALCQAAALTDQTYEAWAAIQERWQGLRAPAPAHPPRPPDLEAADLLTRVGRLAYADPQWTPALGASNTLRPATEIAPDPPALDRLLAGLHRITIGAALLARDHTSIARSMTRGGDLLVATRTLPPSAQVRRPWTPAPPRRTVAMLSGYDVARHTCLDAAEAIAGLVRGAEPAITAQVELGRRRGTPGLQPTADWQPAPGQPLDVTPPGIGVER